MRGYHRWVGLLALMSGPLLAETQYIKSFHDHDNAFVMTPEGAFVPVRELEPGLKLPVEITGKENGQYLFTGPEGIQYRVYVPEVVTGEPMKPIAYCDQSPVVLADDYRIASARGVGEECE